jgi:type I restriction enzyme S subunit
VNSVRYPAHWTNQKLKYVASLRSGESITSDDISDTGDYPVYGGNGVRGYASNFTHDGSYPLIGRQGALCGNINYASGKFWASEHAVVVNTHKGSVVGWLGELLRSMNLNKYSQSAAQPGISVEVIENLPIPVPPESEQEVIANYLDRETTRMDGLIAEKERMLALLEERRAALISRAVTCGLDPNATMKSSGQEWFGEVPTHWVVCQLKRAWASSDYGLSESIRDEGDIAVLRMSCIVDGRIDVSKSGLISQVDEHLLLRLHDLLFNRTNSLDQIAKVGLVDFVPEEPLTFASYLVRIRASELAIPDYLVLLLNASLFLEFARKNAIPAIGQANLSPTRYGEIQIPLPPVHEQKEIVAFLASDAETSVPLRESIKSSIALLKERRAALIDAAVTGQIPLEEMMG